MGWIKSVSPKQLQDNFQVYRGQWMPEMDRCWIREEDNVCVCSRMIRVDGFGGKVEHVTITRGHELDDPTLISRDGSKSFSWAEKMQIKNELFGENRCAIEVYPKQNRLVDASDVYHLWVFDKKYDLPFGIHPKEYKKAINRGYSMTEEDMKILQNYYDSRISSN